MTIRRKVSSSITEPPADLLNAFPSCPTVAWVRRGQGLVGWGIAARATFVGPERFSRAQRWFSDWLDECEVDDQASLTGSGPLAFASFTFDDESPGSVVVIPRVLLGVRDGVAWRTEVTPAQDEVRSDDQGDAPVPRSRCEQPRWRDETAATANWSSSVGEALKRISAGEVDKIVLARAVQAEFDEPLDLRPVLTRLAATQPECWTFHVEDLIGATPELLIRRFGEQVTSRVLAGTVPGSGSADEDERHARRLRASPKNLAEHEYAVRSVAHALSVHCTDLDVPTDPAVLRLPNVQHLATDVSGRLADGSTALALAAQLHPTAAVCGTPTERAMALIAELEDIRRGRYSGPVGWFDGNGDGEIALALRCAQFSSDRRSARLFAGCGLVADSQPGAELAESEAKLDAMRQALIGD
ncbi:MAG: isochorismate synthase [Candidatus Nanopelagicales bacterium]|nr:isochorismate synthase [Candidatus Nanopelagicales bacterium]MDZ4250604.1 isochorismate synthase [Candidatus Nanopelagicales bacterium]